MTSPDTSISIPAPVRNVGNSVALGQESQTIVRAATQDLRPPAQRRAAVGAPPCGSSARGNKGIQVAALLTAAGLMAAGSTMPAAVSSLSRQVPGGGAAWVALTANILLVAGGLAHWQMAHTHPAQYKFSNARHGPWALAPATRFVACGLMFVGDTLANAFATTSQKSPPASEAIHRGNTPSVDSPLFPNPLDTGLPGSPFSDPQDTGLIPRFAHDASIITRFIWKRASDEGAAPSSQDHADVKALAIAGGTLLLAGLFTTAYQFHQYRNGSPVSGASPASAALAANGATPAGEEAIELEQRSPETSV